MEVRETGGGRLILLGFGLAVVYAVGRVLQPLSSVLGTAAVIAVTAYPLCARLRFRGPLPPGLAAGIVTALVCVALALPLTMGAWYFARESTHAYPLVRSWLQGLAAPDDLLPPWVPEQARDYLQDLSLKSFLLENLPEAGAWSGRVLRSMTRHAATAVFDGIVFLASLFLFLRDGPTIIRRLQDIIPLDPGSKHRILRRTHDMVTATVEGVFVAALLQGLLAAIGFAVFRVRFPILLGGLCLLFSPIPIIGPSIVWLPVVLRVAFDGDLARAAGMAVWFLAAVGTVDNVARPFLIGSRSRLPVPLVAAGVLGGIQAFGPMGTFLGPVILAIAVAILDTLSGKGARPAARGSRLHASRDERSVAAFRV